MNARDLRCRVAVRRPVETADEYGDVVQTILPVFHTDIAEVDESMGGIRDYGAGDQPIKAGKTWARRGVDIRERDVLQVVHGPGRGMVWRVVGVFPKQKQTNLKLDGYTGAL